MGDVFLSAASISYQGPFTGLFREEMITEWKEKMEELQVPHSQGFALRETMGDPMKIRQ